MCYSLLTFKLDDTRITFIRQFNTWRASFQRAWEEKKQQSYVLFIQGKTRFDIKFSHL